MIETKKVVRKRRLFEQPEEVAEYVNLGDLKEYIRNSPPPGPFKPNVFYNQEGDQLEVYWSGERAYEEIDPSHKFALLRDMKTREVVGIKIYNPRKATGLVEVKLKG